MSAPIVTAAVVLDVEGTLGPASQVRGRLYDYARPRLGPWIEEHAGDPEVREALRQTRELAGLADTATPGELARTLRDWQDRDVKQPPLKTLQGLIWQRGYDDGELVSRLFRDVAPALRRWHRAGLRLAIYSSGSVQAQLAFLRHTEDGDLSPLVSGYFDTVTAGPKQLPDSYRAIAAGLGQPAPALLFLSDAPAELSAAEAAGWRAVAVVRPGEPFAGADFGARHRVGSFDELRLELP